MLLNKETDDKRVGKLLSEPADCPKSFTRAVSEYSNLSDVFKLKQRNFNRQYAHLYASRLWSTREKLTNAVKKRWGWFLQLSNYIS